jgi:hypothetical protein
MADLICICPVDTSMDWPTNADPDCPVHQVWSDETLREALREEKS